MDNDGKLLELLRNTYKGLRFRLKYRGIRVLAADEKGRAFLRRSAGESPIPVVTKPAAVRQLGGRAEALFALGASAHDLYTLSFLAIEDKKGGSDWRTGPKIVKFP